MATGKTIVLLGLCFLGLPGVSREAWGSGQTDPRDQRDPRLRAPGPVPGDLLRNARRRSATVQGLCSAIEQSDVLVYVFVSRRAQTFRGETRLVPTGGTVRLLHVEIDSTLEPDERIAVLGHELQHVLEIAGAPEVIDLHGVRQLFARIGDRISFLTDSYETSAALEAERQVRQEIRRVRRTGTLRPAWIHHTDADANDANPE